MHFKYENLKNYAPSNIAYCASARLGVPLLFGANLLMENIEYKKCRKCGEVKPLDNFHSRIDSKDGFRNNCKKCAYTPRYVEINSIEGEIWVDIKGLEGLYKISTCLRVKALGRERSNSHMWIDRILKQNLGNHGYYIVNLPKKGKYQPQLVHILLANAFIPNPLKRKYINHKNEIKTDNTLTNLEWCTNRYNISYSKINKPKTSQYIGVYWSKNKKRWRADIRFGDKKVFLGLFKIEYDAHLAYQKALKEIEEGVFTIKIRKK